MEDIVPSPPHPNILTFLRFVNNYNLTNSPLSRSITYIYLLAINK